MEKIWEFHSYLTSSGKDVIEKWYRSQLSDAQAAFDTVIEYLEQRTRNEWRRPEFDGLHGKYRELGEMRFKVRNVQHRIFGFFGPEKRQFTLLIHAIEKHPNYDPPDALETALRRKEEVERDHSRCHACNI